MEAHDKALASHEPFPWLPKRFVDPPISMLEYAMQEGELDAERRNSLLAAQFITTAEVHEAIAKGARTAAEILGGG
jgi:hypothetical protein